MVRRYLCDNSSNPMWLKGVCSTGLMDTLLDWISPERVAKQVDWNAMNVVITNNKRIGIRDKINMCWWYCPLLLSIVLFFSLTLMFRVILSLFLIWIPKCHLPQLISFRAH